MGAHRHPSTRLASQSGGDRCCYSAGLWQLPPPRSFADTDGSIPGNQRASNPLSGGRRNSSRKFGHRNGLTPQSGSFACQIIRTKVRHIFEKQHTDVVTTFLRRSRTGALLNLALPELFLVCCGTPAGGPPRDLCAGSGFGRRGISRGKTRTASRTLFQERSSVAIWKDYDCRT